MNDQYFTQEFTVLDKYTTASGDHIKKQIKGRTDVSHSKDRNYKIGKTYRAYYGKDHNGSHTIFIKSEEVI